MLRPLGRDGLRRLQVTSSTLITLGLTTLFILLASGESAAQYGTAVSRQWSSQSIGYRTGHAEGFRLGQRDLQSGRRFGYEQHSVFRSADRGYRGQYGDRQTYRNAFRSGFTAGYNEGYRAAGAARSYPPRVAVPRSSAPRYSYPGQRGFHFSLQPAFDQGFSDGYEKGLSDGRRGGRFDPVRHGRYRSATRGYDARYGPREQYRNVYRDGFRTGYEGGYRDAARYDRYGRTGAWIRVW
jgi:hypothetical protein